MKNGKVLNPILFLEVMIIDECSLISACGLRNSDYLLRLLKTEKRPFGSVRIILIGDSLQSLKEIILLGAITFNQLLSQTQSWDLWTQPVSFSHCRVSPSVNLIKSPCPKRRLTSAKKAKRGKKEKRKGTKEYNLLMNTKSSKCKRASKRPENAATPQPRAQVLTNLSSDKVNYQKKRVENVYAFPCIQTDVKLQEQHKITKQNKTK